MRIAIVPERPPVVSITLTGGMLSALLSPLCSSFVGLRVAGYLGATRATCRGFGSFQASDDSRWAASKLRRRGEEWDPDMTGTETGPWHQGADRAVTLQGVGRTGRETSRREEGALAFSLRLPFGGNDIALFRPPPVPVRLEQRNRSWIACLWLVVAQGPSKSACSLCPTASQGQLRGTAQFATPSTRRASAVELTPAISSAPLGLCAD